MHRLSLGYQSSTRFGRGAYTAIALALTGFAVSGCLFERGGSDCRDIDYANVAPTYRRNPGTGECVQVQTTTPDYCNDGYAEYTSPLRASPLPPTESWPTCDPTCLGLSEAACIQTAVCSPLYARSGTYPSSWNSPKPTDTEVADQRQRPQQFVSCQPKPQTPPLCSTLNQTQCAARPDCEHDPAWLGTSNCTSESTCAVSPAYRCRSKTTVCENLSPAQCTATPGCKASSAHCPACDAATEHCSTCQPQCVRETPECFKIKDESLCGSTPGCEVTDSCGPCSDNGICPPCRWWCQNKAPSASCETKANEQACVADPTCAPEYTGARCFCDANGCACIDYSYAKCTTKTVTPPPPPPQQGCAAKSDYYSCVSDPTCGALIDYEALQCEALDCGYSACETLATNCCGANEDCQPTANDPECRPQRNACDLDAAAVHQRQFFASDYSNTARQVYPRAYEFRANGTVTVYDGVSPCPPNAVCAWTGITSRTGTWSWNHRTGLYPTLQLTWPLVTTLPATPAGGQLPARLDLTCTNGGLGFYEFTPNSPSRQFRGGKPTLPFPWL